MLQMRNWIDSVGRMKKRKFFLRLIVTTVLITVLPSLVSNIFAYYRVSGIVEEETGNNKLQYLNQTINTLEILLNRIKENSNLLALNRSFISFENFPNGAYYEGLQGAIPEEDLPALYAYLEAKKNTFLTMNSFKLSDQFVDSVYFYDSSKDIVITSDNDRSNRQFRREDFYDKDWYDTVQNIQVNPVFLDTRTAKQYPEGEKDLLSVIYKSKKANNAIIVNLDAAMIYEDIISKLNAADDMYVVSASGNVVFRSQSSAAGVQHIGLSEALQNAKSGSYSIELDGSKKLVSYSSSALLDWTFVNISDMGVYTQGTMDIKQTITYSAGALILLSLLLSYFSSRSLYKPISRLNALAKGRSDGKIQQVSEQANGPDDELSVIGSFVRSTIDERNYYKERLEESLPFQLERFKLSLLQRHTMSLEEIEAKKDYLELNIRLRELSVFLLSIDEEMASNGEDMLAQDLCKIKVIDALQDSEVLGWGTSFFVVNVEKDKIAVVFNLSGKGRQQLFHLAQQLLDEVNARLGVQFSLGVGNICSGIEELPLAYEEAAEALKYRILYGKGYVISMDDIRADNGQTFHYPSQIEEKLNNYIRTACLQEALSMFDAFVAEIEACKHKLHYNQIQPIFIQLFTSIRYSFGSFGTGIEILFKKGTDPYRELLDLGSMDHIVTWFRSLITRGVECIRQEMDARGNQHIAKVIEMLENDYDKDISLQWVAEQLNLNPAYISRLFKQSTGQPFVDYLKQVRIDNSKRLLAEGRLKINEIGRQVGFGSAHYFIKVFKEITGLTPGEYKKIYS
ncbi:AraC family transcriptional regulator [Cytobacillus firmus]|uniref:helix-turn-helix domain-containing protein n=1 Tax=Paenibacillus lautus TaxID=1401 RepID=UPI00384E2D9A|nr:AraC family transcriptional regulator [Cytobacillus firmus]